MGSRREVEMRTVNKAHLAARRRYAKLYKLCSLCTGEPPGEANRTMNLRPRLSVHVTILYASVRLALR